MNHKLVWFLILLLLLLAALFFGNKRSVSLPFQMEDGYASFQWPESVKKASVFVTLDKAVEHVELQCGKFYFGKFMGKEEDFSNLPIVHKRERPQERNCNIGVVGNGVVKDVRLEYLFLSL